jgi:hypothetical protein
MMNDERKMKDQDSLYVDDEIMIKIYCMLMIDER